MYSYIGSPMATLSLWLHSSMVKLRYSSVWILFVLHTLESTRHQEARNHHISLRCVWWHNAVDQNKLDTLQLVWTVTSQQVKIKLKFFLLGDTINFFKKKVFINFFNVHIFCTSFKNSLFKNCFIQLLHWWLVAS